MFIEKQFITVRINDGLNLKGHSPSDKFYGKKNKQIVSGYNQVIFENMNTYIHIYTQIFILYN